MGHRDGRLTGAPATRYLRPAEGVSKGTGMSLRRDGFVVVREVLDRPMLTDLRRRTAALLAAAPADHRRRQRATGSLIHIAADPGFARLIAWPKALAALDDAGLGGARFSSGYVI